jgi:hypothetical protein
MKFTPSLMKDHLDTGKPLGVPTLAGGLSS